MDDQPIKVLIVDDYDLVRHGLRQMIEMFDDLILCGEAKTGAEGVRLAKELRPDVILMDLMLPEVDGIEATRQIQESNPDIPIIALTNSTEDSVVVGALQAGASGYLLKNLPMTELANAIRAAHGGKPTLAPEATAALIRGATREPESAYHFTDREMDVLRLLAEGMTNRQIAQSLDISLSTAKFHISRILAKLNANSRTEAVAIAMQSGVL